MNTTVAALKGNLSNTNAFEVFNIITGCLSNKNQTFYYTRILLKRLKIYEHTLK